MKFKTLKEKSDIRGDEKKHGNGLSKEEKSIITLLKNRSKISIKRKT